MPGKHRKEDADKKKPVGEDRQKIDKETIKKILKKKPEDQ